MSSSSVSFRISRHTQDLAETVHALSQRLVTMEQRLGALELQLQTLRQQPRQDEESEAASLAPIEAHIERLLQDCRQLLAEQPAGSGHASPQSEAVVAELESPSLASSELADSEVIDADASVAPAEEDDRSDQEFPEFHAA